MRRVVFVLLAFLTLSGCATANFARIEAIVDEAVAAPMADRRFAGVVLVARDGEPVSDQTKS
ncbi:MAG: hypothetical protein ACXW28_12095 [Thermoanaerobaculia bacterium]